MAASISLNQHRRRYMCTHPYTFVLCDHSLDVSFATDNNLPSNKRVEETIAALA